MDYCITFTGRAEPLAWGDSTSILHLPQTVVVALHPARRVEDEMKDHPIHLALTHAPEVEGMLLGPGQSPLDHIGVFPGEPFALRLRPATDDRVDTPDDISVALRSGGADLAWDAMTPGKRRGLIYQIGTAKTDTIRSNRIAALTRTLTE